MSSQKQTKKKGGEGGRGVFSEMVKKDRAEDLLTTMCAGDGDLASLSACLL